VNGLTRGERRKDKKSPKGNIAVKERVRERDLLLHSSFPPNDVAAASHSAPKKKVK
jgi:hypothetical protein